jgi:hypothetical protein
MPEFEALIRDSAQHHRMCIPAPPTAVVDINRRRLASYAARCAQSGIRGPVLVQRLAVENAKLSPPLPTTRLSGIASWAEGLSNAA